MLFLWHNVKITILGHGNLLSPKEKIVNSVLSCQIKAKLLLQGHLTTWDQAMQYSVAKMTLPIYCSQLNMTIVAVNLILFESIWQ